MTLTVFTATLGDTDPLRRPTAIAPGVRYVCFTDRGGPAVHPYKPVPVVVGPEGSALASRRLKILANHPALGSPDVTIWHDAAYQLRRDPRDIVARELADGALTAFRHPHRTQIAEEAQVLAQMGLVPADTLRAQVETYTEEGFTQTQISSTGFCLRRQTPAVAAFNARWWAEVERWCWRDQMSVDYALWVSGLTARYMPGHYRDNPYATWYSYQPKKVPCRA